MLACSEAIAVAVAAIWAFRAGFEFWIKARFRRPGPALERRPDDQSLRVGARFADGEKAANVGRVPESAGSVATGLIAQLTADAAKRSVQIWPADHG